jgi:ribonuclease BN (tRNA processing enzyme)
MLWINGVGRILVDTGSGTKDQFYTSGANLNDIDLVAISHLHPDHSVELPGILWPRGGSFRVSGPSAVGPFPSIEVFLDRLFGPDGAFNMLADRTEFNVITVDVGSDEPSEVWRDGNVLIRGIGVPHGNVPTVGYRVDVGEHSVAFSSDQNGSNPAYTDLIQGVDVLVIHLGGSEDSAGQLANLHAKPSVWGQMATDAGARQVVVSHISNTSPDALESSLGYLRGNYDGPVVVAEDLMCVDIE